MRTHNGKQEVVVVRECRRRSRAEEQSLAMCYQRRHREEIRLDGRGGLGVVCARTGWTSGMRLFSRQLPRFLVLWPRHVATGTRRARETDLTTSLRRHCRCTMQPRKSLRHGCRRCPSGSYLSKRVFQSSFILLTSFALSRLWQELRRFDWLGPVVVSCGWRPIVNTAALANDW